MFAISMCLSSSEESFLSVRWTFKQVIRVSNGIYRKPEYITTYCWQSTHNPVQFNEYWYGNIQWITIIGYRYENIQWISKIYHSRCECLSSLYIQIFKYLYSKLTEFLKTGFAVIVDIEYNQMFTLVMPTPLKQLYLKSG